MSNSSSQGDNVPTIVFAVALFASAVAASRLLLLKNPQPGTAMWWAIAAAVVVIVALLFIADNGDFDLTNPQVILGLIAIVSLLVAASRLTKPFLKNIQPGTAKWWFGAAIVCLIAGLFFGPSQNQSVARSR